MLLPKLPIQWQMTAPFCSSSMVAPLAAPATWNHPIGTNHFQSSSTVVSPWEWLCPAKGPGAETPMPLGEASANCLKASTRILLPHAWQLPWLQYWSEKIKKCPHDLVKVKMWKPGLENEDNGSLFILFKPRTWAQPPQPMQWLLLGLSEHGWMNENAVQRQWLNGPEAGVLSLEARVLSLEARVLSLEARGLSLEARALSHEPNGLKKACARNGIYQWAKSWLQEKTEPKGLKQHVPNNGICKSQKLARKNTPAHRAKQKKTHVPKSAFMHEPKAGWKKT